MARVKRERMILPEYTGDASPRQADKIDWLVGNRLKERRVALGLSKTAIARAIGVTLAQVAKYESGANRVAAARLHKLAELLEVPVQWFFEKSSAVSSAPRQAQSSEVDRMAQRLLAAFQSIPDSTDQLRLVELAEQLAQKSA